MQYLVLHKFKSYGVFYEKGAVVAEDKIRNPRLKLAEGKIARVDSDAVFSSRPAAAASEVTSEGVEATAASSKEPAAREGNNKKKPLFVVSK